MVQGNLVEARATLETMRRQNNCPNVSIDFDIIDNDPTSRYTVSDVLKMMFSRKLAFTTLVLCFTTTVINFVGYGFGYCLPIMLPMLNLGVHPPITIMGGCVSELIGYVIAINASSKMPRITQMIVFFALTAVYCGIMSFGITRVDFYQSDVAGKISILFVCLTLQAVTAPGWLVVYTYAGEVYPTMCRSFSGGFAIGCGRLGSIVAPFIIEGIYGAFNSYALFFGLACILMCLTMAFIVMTLKETKGVPLDTCLGEEEPLVKTFGAGSPTSTFSASPYTSGKSHKGQSHGKFSDF